MGIKITIDDKALNRQIAEALKKNPAVTTRAVMDCVLDLAGESIRRAPVETGDLRSMGHATVNAVEVARGIKESLSEGRMERVEGAMVTPSSRVEGVVGFSGPYAVRQHEELSYSHDRTDGYRVQTGKNAGRSVNMVSGGEAKFLENPFNERKGRYADHIKKAVVKNIG